jgi:hypothetical protein
VTGPGRFGAHKGPVAAGATPGPDDLLPVLAVLLDAVEPLLDTEVVGVFRSAWEIDGPDGEELHRRLAEAAAVARALLP